MKFTDKEKIIVKVLVVCMVLFSYGFFFLKPQVTQILKIKDEIKFISSANKETGIVETDIANFDKDVKKLKDNIITIRGKLPDAYEHEELIIDMTELSKASGVEISSMTFADPVALPFTGVVNTTLSTASTGGGGSGSVPVTDQKLLSIGEEVGFISKEEKNDIEIEYVPDGQGFSLDINLTASGTYQEIKRFVELVETKKNLNIFRKFDLNSGSGEKLTAGLTMTYYGIKESLKKNYYFENPPEKVETDIFKPFAVFNARNAIFNKISKVTIENVNEVADFAARLLPYGFGYTPDTMSLTIRKVLRDDQIKPVKLFGDSQFQENVEIYIEEKEGKFYFKVKTASNAFPEDTFVEMAQFEPQGDTLKFLIDSTIRKAKNDYSKYNFIITNQSSKMFDILVINDDPVIPRVSITKNSKNIRVIEQEGGA